MYDYDQQPTLEESRPSRRRRSPDGLYNFVALFFTVLTIGVIAGVAFLINREESIALGQVPPTPTCIPFSFVDENCNPITPTPEPTDPPPTVTPTATPTEPPPPTATGISTGVPAATNTPSLFPFILRDNAITYEQNANEQGCEWLSIAGRVIDENGDPIEGLPIQVLGDDFDALVFSGTAPEFGPGGFEVQVNDEPIEAEFRIQLLNTTGQPFSEPIIVRTLASCERNVAVAVFEQAP